MEIYSTEEQQVEAIKQFWKDHGMSIIAGVVIGLGGLYGFRYYQQSQLEAQESLSAKYAVLTEKLTAEGADKKAWLAEAQGFIESSKATDYALLTSLLAAKEAVALKDYAAAEKLLNSVVIGSKSPELKAIATIRLARVQAEQNNDKAALTTLEAVLPAAFLAQQQEIKGDVLLKGGDEKAALAAYKAAQAASEAGRNPILEVKLNELAHVAG